MSMKKVIKLYWRIFAVLLPSRTQTIPAASTRGKLW